MRDYMHVKSNMPAGATQSPKGDLGERRDHEYKAQRHFKNDGSAESASGYFGASVASPGSVGEK